MKVTGWRIVQAHRAVSAFDGEGARLYGGCWNLPGTRMVYCSESLALATLEILVNLPSVDSLRQYVSIPVEFDQEQCVTLASRDLPEDWAAKPPPRSSQVVGSNWVASNRSAVLAVPSAVIPSEKNFLLNPAHPAFPSIKMGKPAPFALDSRLTS